MADAETRTYDDPCGVARALDVIGQRWAVLVVRDLLLGPKRFRDLLQGLSGMSPNVLSQRLRELKASGVVSRESVGPPVGAVVYRLTDAGAALESVLIELGRWGRGRPQHAAGPMSTDALWLALRTTFDPARAGDLAATIELRVDADRVVLTVVDRRLRMHRGSASSKPDAVIVGDVAGVRAMVYRPATVTEAVDAGTVTIDGDLRTVQRLVDCLR
jgi:DNA-binding HxlR family transcriptional regulator